MSMQQKIVQKQSLTMSHQLRQAIELLEMSHLDLQTFVEAQATENPFLEVERNDQGDSNSVRELSNSPHGADSSGDHSDEKSYEKASEFWVNDQAPKTLMTSDFDSKSLIESIAAKPLSLREHLLSQVNTDFRTETERMIASQLVEDLHETGYYTQSLDELSRRLNIDVELIKEVFEKLKGFDPAGIFATSLRECLELQLKDRGLLTDKVSKVLEYVDLYADAKIEELLSITGMTPDELKSVIDLFKSLNPKPGLLYLNDQQATVVPDVFVEKNDQNTPQSPWQVRLNNETLPKVLVNQDYKIQQAGNLKKDQELRKYYQERMSAANWLVRALDQRAQNTLKVVESIVVKQQDFFDAGVTYLKPLTLRQIALETELHESTVSRITQNKFLSCPRGVFELRYFFNASITNAWTGEDQSALKIQHAIKTLIESENPEKPLSDDALVRKLTEKDLDVARRTIAKYRELMDIPSSYERKKSYKRKFSCAS